MGGQRDGLWYREQAGGMGKPLENSESRHEASRSAGQGEPGRRSEIDKASMAVMKEGRTGSYYNDGQDEQ